MTKRKVRPPPPTRARSPSPIALSKRRSGRKVKAQHWFTKAIPVGFDNCMVLGNDSWADALTRISITGETLVVEVPGLGEANSKEERDHAVKVLHATIHKSAKRRALPLNRHFDGEHLLFTVPTR